MITLCAKLGKSEVILRISHVKRLHHVIICLNVSLKLAPKAIQKFLHLIYDDLDPNTKKLLLINQAAFD